MPRHSHRVKKKPFNFKTIPFVDTHLHGLYGVDFHHCTEAEFVRVSRKLFLEGYLGFTPTTITCGSKSLKQSLERLSRYIKNQRHRRPTDEAIAFGIHAEGPFLSHDYKGAHPSDRLTTANLQKLKTLFTWSGGELLKITIAPESIEPKTLRSIAGFCRKHEISISLGHSSATFDQATKAFQLGFTSVTHAFNAMPFHHRDPGILGAASRFDSVYVECIPDGQHIHTALLPWMTRIFCNRINWVSDCVSGSLDELQILTDRRKRLGGSAKSIVSLLAPVPSTPRKAQLNAKGISKSLPLCGGGQSLVKSVLQTFEESLNFDVVEQKDLIYLSKGATDNALEYLMSFAPNRIKRVLDIFPNQQRHLSWIFDLETKSFCLTKDGSFLYRTRR